MYVFVPIDTEIRCKQVAWSGIRWPHCQIYEAVRVEELSKVILVFFKPVWERKKGLVSRCDLCERPVSLPPDAPLVPLDGWDPREGLASLFDQLAPQLKIEISDRLSEETMHSLLGSVAGATSLDNIHIVPLSLLPGGLVGLGIGILLGMLIYDKGWVTTDFDRFGFVAAVGLIAFVVGALLGAAVYGMFRGRTLASKMIRRASRKYQTDLAMLEQLSAAYPRRVTMVVRKVRSAAPP
jgi:hypothetical protein